MKLKNSIGSPRHQQVTHRQVDPEPLERSLNSQGSSASGIGTIGTGRP